MEYRLGSVSYDGVMHCYHGRFIAGEAFVLVFDGYSVDGPYARTVGGLYDSFNDEGSK